MPETKQTPHTSAHGRSHRSGLGRVSSHRRPHLRLPEPVYYFSGAILFLIVVRLMHADFIPAACGALGIIFLAISKQWRFRPGVILSIICVLLMALLFNRHWAEWYLFPILTGEIAIRRGLISEGLIASAIPVIVVWVYYRMLNSIHTHTSQKWFNKKISVIFFRLIFFFQLFLLLFLYADYLFLKWHNLTTLSNQDSAIIAGAVALLITGIPAILFISKGSPGTKKRRHHRHHHRHPEATENKNPETL